MSHQIVAGKVKIGLNITFLESMKHSNKNEIQIEEVLWAIKLVANDIRLESEPILKEILHIG